MTDEPALVAVAHGSRDPRSAATIAALTDRVRRLRPQLDVRTAFLDLCLPRVETVLSGLARAVVVPLLLGRAYHAGVDIPAAVARATPDGQPNITITGVLGPDPTLERAALRRLSRAGIETDDRDVGVLLAAAGSAHPPANAAVAEVAARWERDHGWAGVVPAFACAAEPTVPQAVTRLRAAGARRIAVSFWFLAPGLLTDKVTRQATAAAPRAVLASPLGADDGVAECVAVRYQQALARSTRPSGTRAAGRGGGHALGAHRQRALPR